jgi:hypothetical protein
MAIFKIISSERGDKQNSVKFGVCPISDEPVIGEEFRCYETHHPVDYSIRAIQRGSDEVVLVCDGFFFYDEQFVGAIIDTTKRGRGVGFRYA